CIRWPYPEFVKAYGENGYFKSLKEFVHFYNTRDTLPHCPAGSPGEGVTCWPVPEVPRNLNTTTEKGAPVDVMRVPELIYNPSRRRFLHCIATIGATESIHLP